MSIYLKPIPPHSGLTSLQGGNAITGEFYHFTQQEHDYLVSLFSGVTTLSATTIYSGGNDIGQLFGPSTFVQQGLNITTGGTASRPIINMAGSILLTAVTASSIFGTSVSATTVYSGGTDISYLFGPSTFVQQGLNITTGGTASRPIINTAGSPVFTAVTASSISATTFYSGGTDISHLFGQGGSDGVWQAVAGRTNSIEPVLAAGSVQSDNSIAFGGTIDIDGNGSYVFGKNASIAQLSDGSAILGGDGNSIGNIGSYSVVIGGMGNSIGAASFGSVIAGGEASTMGTNVYESFIMGGPSSTIGNNVTYGSIFGGVGNTIGNGAYAVTNIGGLINVIGAAAHSSAMIGGRDNLLLSGVSGTTILGGHHMTGRTSFTTYVPYFNIASAFTSASTFILAVQSNGDVTKMSTSGFTAGAATYVQPGSNIATGGTPNAPVINVSSTPSFSSVATSTLNADSIASNEYFSAGTSLNDILSSLIPDLSRTYRRTVEQVGHGLSIGSIVYVRFDDSYAIASNNDEIVSSVVGMVTNVFDSDSFELTSEGYFEFGHLSTILPSLTGGITYYLTKVDDVLSDALPTDGGLVKPVFIAVNASSLHLLNGTISMSETAYGISQSNAAQITSILGLSASDAVTFNSVQATSITANMFSVGSRTQSDTQSVMLQGTISTSSATPVDATGLSFPVDTQSKYSFQFNVTYQSANASTGLGLTINGPTSPLLVSASHFGTQSAGFAARFITGYDDLGAGAIGTVASATTNYTAHFLGTLVTGANAGILQLRFCRGGSANSVTIMSGTTGFLTKST